jgi:hypothetical protein
MLALPVPVILYQLVIILVARPIRNLAWLATIVPAKIKELELFASVQRYTFTFAGSKKWADARSS